MSYAFSFPQAEVRQQGKRTASLQELAHLPLRGALRAQHLHPERGRPPLAERTARAVRQQVPRRLQQPGCRLPGRAAGQPDPGPDAGHAPCRRRPVNVASLGKR